MNIMGSKRMINNCSQGSLLNAINGEKTLIPMDQEFVIGRALTSSLIVEQIYISRRHCIIKFENNQFIIYDNNTSTGTFLNCKKIPKGKSNSVVLRHGDLISFGDKRKFEFIFKFSLSSNDIKKTKIDENGDISEVNNLKIEFSNLHKKILDIKVEKLVLKDKIRTQISEFQQMFNTVLEQVRKFGTEVIKQKSVIQNLNKTIEEFNIKLIQQGESSNHNETRELMAIDSMKSLIHNILENDFQCPICNEVVFKVFTANCAHSFCEICLNKWLRKSNICPVCRTNVQTTTNCLAMDTLISNIYELIGGTIQEQRNSLKKERFVTTRDRTPRRGRKRTANGRRTLHPLDQGIDTIITHFPPGIRIPHLFPAGYRRIDMNDQNIEIVDLTNSNTPTR